ncbi:PrsW family glutamic-type intramembrane protease [Luteitalea pratensis]|nr:PrsW family glutamic-type intramembrane protease [Luteitalea pratensis]
MAIAACYGVFQLAVLGSATRSVRMANLLLAVTLGLYGCGTVAVVLEVLYTRSVAALTHTPVGVVVRTASYTVDPVIEEVVKVLPLLILVLFRRIRAQWGLTDYLLLGAGTGSGFALVEATMRWSHAASRAVGDLFHGWTIRVGLFGVGAHIPGPFEIAAAWLPAPAGDAVTFLHTGSQTTNLHLAWSAVAGFGVGLLVRGHGRQRWLGLLPWLYAALDHMAYNHDVIVGGRSGLWMSSAPVRAVEPLLWLFPVVLLAVSGRRDWREIRAAKAASPDVLLPAERAGESSSVVLGRFATVGLPWTPFIAWRFALVRRSLMYARLRDDAVADQLHPQVRSVREQIERASNPAVWRALSVRFAQAASLPPLETLLRLYWHVAVSLVLLLPSVLFLIVGGFPSTSGIQRLFATSAVFGILTVFAIATVTMVAWCLVCTVRAIPGAFRDAYTDAAVRESFRTGVGAGALGIGALSLSRVLAGAGANTSLMSNLHILDAISRMTSILGFGLTALSLLALFAALLGGPGGGGILVAAIARIGLQDLLQMVAISGIGALGALGAILAMASGGGSGGGDSGDGDGEGEGEGKGDQGAIDEVLKDATPGRTSKPGMGADKYSKPGGLDQATADFDQIAGNNPVTDYGGGIRSTELPNGTTVSVRPGSTQGSPTIQINSPTGNPIKIRYVP